MINQICCRIYLHIFLDSKEHYQDPKVWYYSYKERLPEVIHLAHWVYNPKPDSARGHRESPLSKREVGRTYYTRHAELTLLRNTGDRGVTVTAAGTHMNS